MSVARVNVNKCIGCGTCFKVCPMDVFRINKELGKSVLAYPENCQSCGQCYYNCPTESLTIVNDNYGYALTAYRAATTVELSKINSPTYYAKKSEEEKASGWGG